MWVDFVSGYTRHTLRSSLETRHFSHRILAFRFPYCSMEAWMKFWSKSEPGWLWIVSKRLMMLGNQLFSICRHNYKKCGSLRKEKTDVFSCRSHAPHAVYIDTWNFPKDYFSLSQIENLPIAQVQAVMLSRHFMKLGVRTRQMSKLAQTAYSNGVVRDDALHTFTHTETGAHLDFEIFPNPTNDDKNILDLQVALPNFSYFLSNGFSAYFCTSYWKG